MTRIGTLLAAVVAGTAAIGVAGPADAQLLHRPRCSSVACPDSLFRLELERITRTEGPLASDRDADDLRMLRQRLQRELRSRPGDPWLLLAESEITLGLGDPLAALGAATRALEAGADSALAMRAQGEARMRVAGGAEDGAALYLAALGRMTRESAPRFLADLLPLLSETELDWWRSAHPERLRQWSRDNWALRAALAGVTLEERLVEHVRRLAVAVRRYDPPGTGSGAVPHEGVLRDPGHRVLPYDDRGIVYVRRGEPLEVLRTPAPLLSSLPTMTWVYPGAHGGVDAFHFGRTRMGGTGYRALLVPGCTTTDVAFTESRLVENGAGWVQWNAMTDDEARRAATSCLARDAFARQSRVGLSRVALRREAMRAMHAESPRPPFPVPVPAFFDFFAFRGPDGRTELIAAVVVPVEENGARPIDVLVTIADETGGVVRRESATGRVRTAVERTIVSDGDGWGVTYASMEMAPTERATFRVLVRDPEDTDQGALYAGAIAVPAYAEARPAISDILVTGSGPATWSRGSTRLFLLPARAFVPGSTVALFYELYDVPAGTTYRTELEVTPVQESVGSRLWRAITGSGEVRLRFDAELPADGGAVHQELRSLTLPVDEGRYRLRVRITTSTGATMEETRDIVIAADAAAASGAPARQATDTATQGTDAL